MSIVEPPALETDCGQAIAVESKQDVRLQSCGVVDILLEITDRLADVGGTHFASAAAINLPMLSAEHYPYMRELAVHVADGSHDGTPDFGFGLEVILDGLERLRKQR